MMRLALSSVGIQDSVVLETPRLPHCSLSQENTFRCVQRQLRMKSVMHIRDSNGPSIPLVGGFSIIPVILAPQSIAQVHTTFLL